MIKQSLTFNDILEKKFKILRTSIMLGNLRNRDETLSEYEDTAKEIDRIRTSVYEEKLAAKMYTTVTLEEEENRLKDLISFVENRIEERNSFVNDYNRGITPNPCVLCNKEVKFNFLYQKMFEYGCDYIATGHYAKIIDGKLFVSSDLNKDQTYFLAQLSSEQLSKLMAHGYR